MESPLKGRAIIDIDATVQQNLSIILALLAAHALSGCDTVASYYGIGKGIMLKVLRAGKKHYLYHALNRTIVPYVTCPPAPFHFHELLYATEDITFFLCILLKSNACCFIQVVWCLMCLVTARFQWNNTTECWRKQDPSSWPATK